MKYFWRILLPAIFLGLNVYVIFGVYLGALLAAMLGLPWTYIFSFSNGLLYGTFPNLSGNVGIFTSLVPALAINAFLLYLLGKKIDNRKAVSSTS